MKCLRITVGRHDGDEVVFEQPLKDAKIMLAVGVQVLLGGGSVSSSLDNGRNLDAEIIDVPRKKL